MDSLPSKKANLVTAIDPDTETFINYIKDQKAAGKVITAQKEGRKVYKSQAEIDKETEDAAIKAIKDATKINKLAEKEQNSNWNNFAWRNCLCSKSNC